jgi:hypothetical protein
MSSSVSPGTEIAQNDPSPKTSRLGPRGALAGTAEKSMLENFDLPEKWFATAARAKKLASALPKTTRFGAPMLERPRCDLDEDG